MKFKKGDYIFYIYYEENNDVKNYIKVIYVIDLLLYLDDGNIYNTAMVEQFYAVDVYFTRKMKILELLNSEII